MLNKQSGNMYPFVTHTWNPIRGKCLHDCVYCYMKVFPQKPMHLDEKTLKDDLGEGKYIFVGSSTDMWELNVNSRWITDVLYHIRSYQENIYLFQSKNPERFREYIGDFPKNTILATTIETNRVPGMMVSEAPSPQVRKDAMTRIYTRKTVTIEPIMDFDIPVMIGWINDIHPEFVSIGADSKNHHLPEPSGDKIRALIEGLRPITKVIQKDNLKRLL